jgi:hypothetical protein
MASSWSNDAVHGNGSVPKKPRTSSTVQSPTCGRPARGYAHAAGWPMPREHRLIVRACCAQRIASSATRPRLLCNRFHLAPLPPHARTHRTGCARGFTQGDRWLPWDSTSAAALCRSKRRFQRVHAAAAIAQGLKRGTRLHRAGRPVVRTSFHPRGCCECRATRVRLPREHRSVWRCSALGAVAVALGTHAGACAGGRCRHRSMLTERISGRAPTQLPTKRRKRRVIRRARRLVASARRGRLRVPQQCLELLLVSERVCKLPSQCTQLRRIVAAWFSPLLTTWWRRLLLGTMRQGRAGSGRRGLIQRVRLRCILRKRQARTPPAKQSPPRVNSAHRITTLLACHLNHATGASARSCSSG